MLSNRKACEVCVVSAVLRKSSLAKTAERVWDQQAWHLLRADVVQDLFNILANI